MILLNNDGIFYIKSGSKAVIFLTLALIFVALIVFPIAFNNLIKMVNSGLVVTVALCCMNLVAAIEVKCKGMDVQVTEEQIMNVKGCLESAGVVSVQSLTPETAGCFSRCVMEKKQLVDENNKPHKENINKMIDQALPEALREEWKGAMEKCLDNEGQNLKSSAEDPKCMSYVPLSLCSHMAFVKICQPA